MVRRPVTGAGEGRRRGGWVLVRAGPVRWAGRLSVVGGGAGRAGAGEGWRGSCRLLVCAVPRKCQSVPDMGALQRKRLVCGPGPALAPSPPSATAPAGSRPWAIAPAAPRSPSRMALGWGRCSRPVWSASGWYGLGKGVEPAARLDAAGRSQASPLAGRARSSDFAGRPVERAPPYSALTRPGRPRRPRGATQTRPAPRGSVVVAVSSCARGPP